MLFLSGDIEGNKFWNLVRDVLKAPSKEQIRCHSPKPILLDTGEVILDCLGDCTAGNACILFVIFAFSFELMFGINLLLSMCLYNKVFNSKYFTSVEKLCDSHHGLIDCFVKTQVVHNNISKTTSVVDFLHD